MKPRHIVYIIWLVIALLGVICYFVPAEGWKIGTWNLRWPTLAKVLGTEDKIDSIQTLVDTITLQEIDTTGLALPTQDCEQPEITQTKIKELSTRIYLSAFYQSLDSTDMMPIRVVHYGDSQIEEDRITSVLREHLQKQYGGGGVGLIPLHQTIPTATTRQSLSIDNVIQRTQGGPKRYLVYGPKSMQLDNNDYGIMGQVAIMDNNLVTGSENLILKVEPFYGQPRVYNYFNRIRLISENIHGQVFASNISSSLESNQVVSVPDQTTRSEIHLQGRGKVYAISLESDRGIIVDNIPMRGCSGNIFTRIDSIALRKFFKETNTRLIILQYGGNMIPYNKNSSTIDGYVKGLHKQVQYIRSCAPQASILFIGPSDMSTRIDGEMETYPLIPYMDKLLEKMAREEKIGYWSLYEAMGGKNSMLEWRQKGLAGSDYVHFTQAGAKKTGEMLSAWLEEGNIFQ